MRGFYIVTILLLVGIMTLNIGFLKLYENTTGLAAFAVAITAMVTPLLVLWVINWGHDTHRTLEHYKKYRG